MTVEAFAAYKGVDPDIVYKAIHDGYLISEMKGDRLYVVMNLLAKQFSTNPTAVRKMWKGRRGTKVKQINLIQIFRVRTGRKQYQYTAYHPDGKELRFLSLQEAVEYCRTNTDYAKRAVQTEGTKSVQVDLTYQELSDIIAYIPNTRRFLLLRRKLLKHKSRSINGENNGRTQE